jgi:hypothetical protein
MCIQVERHRQGASNVDAQALRGALQVLAALMPVAQQTKGEQVCVQVRRPFAHSACTSVAAQVPA